MIVKPPIDFANLPNYIDLSTSGLIAQILIAGGIGGLVFLRKLIWRKIKKVALFWKRNRK